MSLFLYLFPTRGWKANVARSWVQSQSLRLPFLICVREERGSAPPHTQNLTRSTHWVSHQAVGGLGCLTSPVPRGRETCPRSHLEKAVELRHHPALSAPGPELRFRGTWPAGETLGMAGRTRGDVQTEDFQECGAREWEEK